METFTMAIDDSKKTCTAVLSVDGQNVAWLSYSIEHEQVFLHSIETRSQYRNKGYSKELLNRVAKHYRVERVMHSGGFTPEGFNYVFRNIARPNSVEPARVDCESMDFICNWETMAKHTRFCGHD